MTSKQRKTGPFSYTLTHCFPGTPEAHYSLAVFGSYGCVFLLARKSLSSIQKNLDKRFPGATRILFSTVTDTLLAK